MAKLATLLAVLALSPNPASPLQETPVFVRPPHAIHLDRTSVAAGETVTVFARSDANAAELDCVAATGGTLLFQPRDVAIEPQHDRDDEATHGPRWTKCAELQIPASATSGVYTIRATTGSGARATAPLVVRPASPGARSRALVLYPEAALAATNEWGGASLFTTRFGPPAPRVALARPLFVAGDGAYLDAVVNDAIGALLAARKLAVEHATDLDLERDETLLDPYDLVLLPHRHPYLTTGMRASLDAFVRNGGNVLILTGGFGVLHARLEDQGRSLVAFGMPELDPLFSDRRVTGGLAAPFALGPVNDPEERSFGLASRHAFLGLPRAEGFGYGRARSRLHPFFSGIEFPFDDLVFGRRDLGERLLVAFGGACDGANVELLDGQVVASRASGAPWNLRILATAPARAGYAAIAEFHAFGSLAHFGAEGFAREAIGPEARSLPIALRALGNALDAYAPPRRSRVRNGGFERWRRLGGARLPLAWDPEGALAPIEGPGGDLALGHDASRQVAAVQQVELADGPVHLLAWARDATVSLEIGNGFLLTRALPAGPTEFRGGVVYGRATVDGEREAYVTCRLSPMQAAVVDDVELIDDAQWRRALALDWRIPAVPAGEAKRERVALDGGSAYLIAFFGSGEGQLFVSAEDGSGPRAVPPAPGPGMIAAGVWRPERPGETVTPLLEVRTLGRLTDVEIAVLPLRVPTGIAARAEADHLEEQGAWTLAEREEWQPTRGVAGAGVDLLDEEIARDVEPLRGEARLTLWTFGTGRLTATLIGAPTYEGDAPEFLHAELPVDAHRWTPHVVRVPAELGGVAARLVLTADGAVAIDELRLESERDALRDDRVSNGAFEMAPGPTESALTGADSAARVPGWSVEGGALLLDAGGRGGSAHALRIAPIDERAVARLRVPDALSLDRAWRVTATARCAEGARGEIALLLTWPGEDDAVELARAAIEPPRRAPGQDGERFDDVSLGATADRARDALIALGHPAHRAGMTALARIEIVAIGGAVTIDDLTLDAD